MGGRLQLPEVFLTYLKINRFKLKNCRGGFIIRLKSSSSSFLFFLICSILYMSFFFLFSIIFYILSSSTSFYSSLSSSSSSSFFLSCSLKWETHIKGTWENVFIVNWWCRFTTSDLRLIYVKVQCRPPLVRSALIPWRRVEETIFRSGRNSSYLLWPQVIVHSILRWSFLYICEFRSLPHDVKFVLTYHYLLALSKTKSTPTKPTSSSWVFAASVYD